MEGVSMGTGRGGRTVAGGADCVLLYADAENRQNRFDCVRRVHAPVSAGGGAVAGGREALRPPRRRERPEGARADGAGAGRRERHGAHADYRRDGSAAPDAAEKGDSGADGQNGADCGGRAGAGVRRDDVSAEPAGRGDSRAKRVQRENEQGSRARRGAG